VPDIVIDIAIVNGDGIYQTTKGGGRKEPKKKSFFYHFLN